MTVARARRVDVGFARCCHKSRGCYCAGVAGRQAGRRSKLHSPLSGEEIKCVGICSVKEDGKLMDAWMDDGLRLFIKIIIIVRRTEESLLDHANNFCIVAFFT